VAAISYVFTISRVAEMLGENEDWYPGIGPRRGGGRAMLTGPNPRFRATPSPLKRPRDVPNLASDKPI
jgi:hypothetical protein